MKGVGGREVVGIKNKNGGNNKSKTKNFSGTKIGILLSVDSRAVTSVFNNFTYSLILHDLSQFQIFLVVKITM